MAWKRLALVVKQVGKKGFRLSSHPAYTKDLHLFREVTGNGIGRYNVWSLKAGKFVLSENYDNIEYHGSKGEDILELRGDLKKGVRWGLFSVKTGKFLLPVEYDGIEKLTDDLFEARMFNKSGVYQISKKKFITRRTYHSVDIEPKGPKNLLLLTKAIPILD